MTGARVEKDVPRRYSHAGKYMSATPPTKLMKILKLYKEDCFQMFMVVVIPPGFIL